MRQQKPYTMENAYTLENAYAEAEKENDTLRAKIEQLTAEIEDWRGRLASQCGQTLAARYERDQARAALASKETHHDPATIAPSPMPAQSPSGDH